MKKLIQGFEQLKVFHKEFGMDNEPTEKILKELTEFRVFIPIFGRIGTEKHILIDTLLEADIGSRQNSVFQSDIPVEIRYGKEEEAKLLGTQEKWVSPERLFNGKSDLSNTDAVCYSSPLSLFKKIPDITLVHIPEFDPQTGIASKTVRNYISKSIASIFLFPSDPIKLENSEINFLKLLKLSGVSLFVSIVKKDFVPEDLLISRMELLKASLLPHIAGLDVSYCTPDNRKDQFEELIDFLFKIQEESKILARKKYSRILINQLELLQIFIKTRISNRSYSLLALDSKDEDANLKIENLIEFIKTEESEEEPVLEGIEEIKADVKKIIHPDESTFVKMLLNYQDISEKTKSAMKVDLSELNKMINTHLPALLKRGGPENAPELLSDFKAEYSKFRDFILYDELIGKNIVGFGGACGSGKTSFLNSLLIYDVLPVNKEPFQSLPIYILRGKQLKVQGVNIFDAKIDLEQYYNEKPILNEEEANELKRILNTIFVFTPDQEYRHIAFLDTMGYDRQDTVIHPNDANKRSLNSSDFIMWFINAEDGTISENDLKYIGSLRKDIPKIFVITNAKKRTVKELSAMVVQVKTSLNLHGIPHEGVYTFDVEKPNGFDSRSIFRRLENWNDVKYEDLGFAKRFKELFVKCREFYESEINRENKRLNGLEKALSLSENSYVRDYLQAMSKDMKIKKEQMTEINKDMKQLQDHFFKQIKTVSDLVGIAMPEPSEIDLIRDSVQDSMQILEECRTRFHIPRRNDYSDILIEGLVNLHPVINQCKGGSEYRNGFFDLLESNCKADPCKIKINDLYKDSEEYQKMNSNSDNPGMREGKEMRNQMNNAENMRTYFKRSLGRKYPIPEHPLKTEDDYIKELYLKMLCVVVLYDNEPTEAQTMFLQRLISGISVEEYISEFIKKAMMADVDFAGEFIRLFNGSKLSHSFVVDALIVVSIEGLAKKKQLEFISELCEMLSIKKPVLEYLASLSVAILEQDSNKYQLVLEKLPVEVENRMFFGYIKSFFTGCLINTQEHLYYYSKEKKPIPFTQQNLTIYGVKKIRFENVIIDLTELSPYFESFGTLEFINCDFIGGKRGIRIGDGVNLKVEKCSFKGFRGFKSPIFIFSAVMKEMIVNHCDFLDCTVDANWMEGLGSVFSLNGRMNQIIIQNSAFTKCGLKNVRNFHDSGAVGYIRADSISLINNTFTACRCDTGRLFYISSGKIQEEGNRNLGAMTKLSYY